ncbi:MAG TPA: hypothetical protein VIV40_15695 [Kofleriaceae bacterium]
MQSTYGIGGYGFLLSPSPAIRVMVTDDRELVFFSGEREVARITPNDEPATGAANWLSSTMARFGEGGPLLELADGVALESVLLRIDTGLPHVEWSGLAPGMVVELPLGVALVPAAPNDADPYFELHAIGARDEFISFMPMQVAADEIVINPAPYQRLVKQGKLDDMTFTECAYEHDGKPWRQIFYAVPLDEDVSVVVRAQASEPRVELLFQAAQAAASTLVPLR